MEKHRILFVDDEKNILQAARRMLYSKRNVWEMTFVDGGAKALEALALQHYDVLVTDIMMPGMDGVELLEHVVERHPETARIVLSGQVSLDEVVRSVRSAHQYIAKPSTKDDLISRIENVLALRKYLVDAQLQGLLNGLSSLPVLPDIYASVSEELGREEVSLQRVGDIISQDVSICAKILKLINSPFFGLRTHVKNIHQAVAYLGIDPLRALILTAQLFLEYEHTPFKGFSMELLWEHCLRVSEFSSLIAELENLDGQARETCCMGGLLHDVGKIVLLSNKPEEYSRVLEMVRGGMKPHEAEMEIFGATHSQVTGYLMGLWGLSGGIVQCIVTHHEHPLEGVGLENKIVQTANLIDHGFVVIHEDYERPELDAVLHEDADIMEKLPKWKEHLRTHYKKVAGPLATLML